jgi:UDP-N-acetylglucosamine 2-epimerase (non-hydrolysing)
MLHQALEAFDIRPEHDLSIMTPDQQLGELTARALESVSSVLRTEEPHVVVVQGDTTTAFAAGLAGFYARVPVAHVEAGLRTGDLDNPFPEELNRVLIDRFATFCFAPTDRDRQALLDEGIPADRIYVTGNTGIDAFDMIRGRVGRASKAPGGGLAAELERIQGEIVLITLHRREIFGPRLAALLIAVRDAAGHRPDRTFVYPVHMNPNVRLPAEATLSGLPNVILLEPQPYEAFVRLMERATVIVTDSGGIQEEALSLGTPVVALRERTERHAGVESGAVILAGTSGESLGPALDEAAGRARLTPPAQNPYGDGHAAERILGILSTRLGDP